MCYLGKYIYTLHSKFCKLDFEINPLILVQVFKVQNILSTYIINSCIDTRATKVKAFSILIINECHLIATFVLKDFFL